MFKRGDSVFWRTNNSGVFIGKILAIYRDLNGIEEAICQVVSRDTLKFIAPVTELKVYIPKTTLEISYAEECKTHQENF
jgi:hypothetical protein